jgi:formate dehydrogenase iron-sulfur subunit
MSVTIYLPGDANALALGADQVAEAVTSEADRRGIDIRLVRNGSRGLFWLEPLLEVETPTGRIAYGPLEAADVPGLFEAGLHTSSQAGDSHPLCLGPTEEIPYLASQQRVSLSRVGVVDPRSLDDYLAHGGGAGLDRARQMSAAEIVQEVTESGLRGRGGAAFPTGIKWNTVLNTPADQKYIVCNADEGDSGTFADRLLMEGDPFSLFEGMAIAGLAVGATRGYIYLRSEYPHAATVMQDALAKAEDWLDSFKIEIRKAAGSYVCGEETALLESIEGRRGIVRNKPPLPAIEGLFGNPTVINNVISLISVSDILAKGAAFYHAYGVGRSRGTLPFQLAGNLKYGGLVEVPFGLTLRELLYDFGGGSASGRPLRAVQVGGPLGAYMPESQFDTPLDYEAFTEVGAVLGHGGIVAFDDSVDMVDQAHYAMKFCAEESCGKCTPCRIGSTRGMEVIERIRHGDTKQIELLRSLCDTMLDGSMCAMGGMTPYPVLSALNHFAEDFQ